MKFKAKPFIKIDKRNTGYGEWAYYINRHDFNPKLNSLDSMNQYLRWREWCWTTWGPSKELDLWMEDRHRTTESQNPHWCWSNNQYHSRIYLRTDKELSQFLLKWT